MCDFYRTHNLMEELFLKACAPEIEKILPHVGSCCRGCIHGLQNQLGHECLSEEGSIERGFMEVDELKRAAIMIQGKLTEVLDQVRLLISKESPRYDSITINELLDFLTGEEGFMSPPLVRLAWDYQWYTRVGDLIKEAAKNRETPEQDPARQQQDILEYHEAEQTEEEEDLFAD